MKLAFHVVVANCCGNEWELVDEICKYFSPNVFFMVLQFDLKNTFVHHQVLRFLSRYSNASKERFSWIMD